MGYHVIENDVLKVTIADAGAELISVIDKKTGEEKMWDANPAVWNRHAPILFPFVGKVAEGCYRYQGKEYPMKTQHGFARDRDFTLAEENALAITMALQSDETSLEIYPFEFELLVTHALKAGDSRSLEVKWEIRNKGGEDMYYSIGGHPGFVTPNREEYYLEFPGKDSLEYLLLNTDTGLAVTTRSYQLETEDGFVSIRPDMFDLDALVFGKGQIAQVRLAKADKSPYVTLNCPGFPFVGIWSKPEGDFVCLEPWLGRTDDDGFAGELPDKTGEQVLAGGETKTVSYELIFHE